MKSCRGLVVALILCGLISTSIAAHAAVPASEYNAAAEHQSSGIQLAQAAPSQPAAPEPAPPQQPAQTTQPAQPEAQQADQSVADVSQPAAEEPVGNVVTLQGTATITHNGASAPLKLKDDIFKGDTLQTGKSSTLIVTFLDDTTLNMSAGSRVVVDNFVYQEGGKANAALINVARGTMAFVAASVAKTGDMKIETPTATLGIRGTTGIVDVPEGAAAGGTNHVGVKLYPDADGKVGRIEVKARDGAPLGMLTQGASGFTVRRVMVQGFGMPMSAMPMVMSAQQMARDRGFVQRVHVMQGIGRNIVMQQRNFRMQNPQRQPNIGRPGSQQPGLRNQPGLQPQPGQHQPGGLRNQRSLQNRPGQPQKPRQEKRSEFQNAPGQQRQSGVPGQFGQRQGGPRQQGLQRQPGMPNHATPQRQPGQFGQRQLGLPGQLGGIAGRLGIPVPQSASAAPRPVPQGQPGQQRRPPSKQEQDSEEIR